MDKININYFTPSHPTYPVQDKFNQVHLYMGFSKIEHISTILLSSMLNNPENKNFEPEVIINEAIDQAILLLNQIEERLKNITENNNIIK